MTTSSSSSDTWIPDKSYLWINRFGFNLLRRGPLPKHVAFIMDGNRRFAKEKCVKKSEGHEKGFSKLTETLQWCLDLGIFEVTVYAFSIENFKRSKEEVDTLMDLARDKFRKLIKEWKKLEESGVCVRIIGSLTLIPKDLLLLILVAMLLTKDNKRACLNIAFSYTGKDELTKTASLVVHGLQDGKLNDTNVSADLMDQCLYTYLSPPPELVIRTSGEHRISDFIPWQSAHSYWHFVNVLWPDFSSWNFMCSIFCYQHYAGRLMKPFKNHHKPESKVVYKFVNNVQKNRLYEAVNMCECEGRSLDWEKLNSFTKEELYDYYLKNIHPPDEPVSES